MDIKGWFAKAVTWLKYSLPIVIGVAVAIVLRKRPVSNPADQEPARHDMAQADKHVETLEREQQVLADQHQAIEEILKPTPVVIQADKSLEDAVNTFNRGK